MRNCQSLRPLGLTERLGRLIAIAMSFAITMLILSGCGTIGGSNAEPDLWGPFQSQSTWIVDDGRLRLEISGFERGHRPGLDSEFDLTIDNRLGETLDTTICVYLVDESAIVQKLEKFDVHLEDSQATARNVIASFDEGVDARPYGLAILMQDWGAVVQTVRLGIPDEEAGPWLDATELPCE